MLALIQMILALIILGPIYRKFIKCETTNSISKKQAIVPVILGIVSVVTLFAFTIGEAVLFRLVGISKDNITNPALKALFAAFTVAGFTEEISKLIMMLISFKAFKPKNVYEYILIGFGVSMGFTLFEEFLYGAGLTSLFRIPTMAIHVVFGLIMSKNIGLAKHKKVVGDSGTLPLYLKAIIIPIALHTIYDAATGFNPAFAEGADEVVVGIGVLVAFIVEVASTIIQIVYIVKTGKNAGKYSSMQTVSA